MKLTTLLIMIFLLLFSGTSFSANQKLIGKKAPKKKIRIAVMKFQANNCSPSMARAVSEILTGKLFEMDNFIILERSQIDLIVKEQGFNEENCTDSECAVQMGKILSVQKMVMGSVNKLGDYKLEIRVINVADGSVDIRTPATAADEDDFEDEVSDISERIEYFYLGYPYLTGIFDVSVSTAGFYAFGDFAKGVSFGYGANLNVSFNKLLENDISLIFNTGYYSFSPEMESIQSLTIVPILFFAGYPVKISRNTKIIPAFGAGYIFSRVVYDTIEERTYGEYNYSTEYYYNPVLSLRAEIDIKIIHRWYLLITPGYSVFFESERIGQYASADFGVKMLF